MKKVITCNRVKEKGKKLRKKKQKEKEEITKI